MSDFILIIVVHSSFATHLAYKVVHASIRQDGHHLVIMQRSVQNGIIPHAMVLPNYALNFKDFAENMFKLFQNT